MRINIPFGDVAVLAPQGGGSDTRNLPLLGVRAPN